MERKDYWNCDFAYAVGLFTADGCLSSDGRHLEFTSKDEQQVKTFARCLNLKNSITLKSRGNSKEKKYFHIQFGDVKLYRFLNSIGLTSKKSLTIKELQIPKIFMPDFTRGLLDGDGSMRVNSHPESKLLQFKTSFYSGSKVFLEWLSSQLESMASLEGGTLYKSIRAYGLSYGKRDSIRLIKTIYYSDKVPCLERKKVIVAGTPYTRHVVSRFGLIKLGEKTCMHRLKKKLKTKFYRGLKTTASMPIVQPMMLA